MNVSYLLLAAIVAPMVLAGCNPLPKNSLAVSSFEMCQKAGGNIMESHPRQCAISDMVFVENLEKELSSENSVTAFTGEIIKIENGRDGYSVTLKSTTDNTKGDLAEVVLSIPNLGRDSKFDFDSVKEGNVITVVGDNFMMDESLHITARTAFSSESMPVDSNGGIGDGAESLDDLLAADYIGKAEIEAAVLAKKNGVMFRVVERDGQMLPTTRDFRPGRINAVVENGKIVSYKVEGNLGNNNSNAKQESPKSTTEILNIGSKKVQCTGAFLQECYMVDGEYFYDGIIGFEFETGYEYKIKVKKTPRCDFNRPETCPQDIGTFKYEFVEEILKTKVTTAADYIGLTKTAAEALAKKNGVSFRIVSEDGQNFGVTMDFRPGRINAVVKNEKIISYKIEGDGFDFSE